MVPVFTPVVSKVAPAPGDAAPAVATVRALPAQSVTVMLAAELEGWAVICSMTICAAMVAEVSWLFLLLVAMAVMNIRFIPNRPMAITTRAIIISMRLNPWVAIFLLVLIIA